MGWRESVRKQIDKAKSRRKENEISKKIYESEKKLNETESEEIHDLGRSLSYDYYID